MQWYLSALMMLLTLVGAGLLTGGLLVTWLPARVQAGARVFLSVSLGWAVIALVATLLGWFGPGYGRCHCTAVTGALCVVGAWTGRKWLRQAGGDCWRLTLFCLVASVPVLGPLTDHGSFALYNDTHFYLGHALWLQEHGFEEAARTDGGHPLWGTVALMQSDPPLRMGAGFLLGWVQAMFGLELPHQIFPVVAALAVICAAMGVGAATLAVCPGRWAEAWLGALAVAVTVNGFVFGAAHGFLPQTWGLAFASAAVGLRGLEIGTHAERSGVALWRVGVPVGVLAAASMHCYWELAPLEGPALACAYLLPWPGRDRRAWGVTLRRASVPLATCVGLVNVEWLRAVQGILHNAHAVVANPVDWPLWHFPAHALGLKSSVWERNLWITQGPPRSLTLAGCALFLAWAGLMWWSADGLTRKRRGFSFASAGAWSRGRFSRGSRPGLPSFAPAGAPDGRGQSNSAGNSDRPSQMSNAGTRDGLNRTRAHWARRGGWWRPPARWMRPCWQALVSLWIWTALATLLILYFRYRVPSPWGGVTQGIYPDGTGQSWSQYKVTTWASFAVVGLVTAGLTGGAMASRSTHWRVGVVVLLSLWIGTGLGWNLRLAHWRGEQVSIDTGTRRDALAPCLAMRQRLAGIPTGDWVFLDWPPDGRSEKFLELMVSLLAEHPLAARWSEGQAGAMRVSAEDVQRSEADCQWALRYRPPGRDTDAAALTTGGMTLERVGAQR